MSDPVADVKARWTMPMLIEHLTGEAVPANGKIQSLFNPDDQTPSMHIYGDHFHCYSTGRGGDIIALVMAVKRCSFLSALELLTEEADNLRLDAVDRPKVERKEFVVPTDLTSAGPSLKLPGVPPNMELYLWTEGYLMWSPSKQAWAIPHYKDGKIAGIKYRHFDGRKTSEPGSVFTGQLYRVCDTIDTCVAVVVEGESDCWAMQAHFGIIDTPHFAVFALPTGANTIREEWFNELAGMTVYICTDNDTAGKTARDKLLRMSRYQYDVLEVPKLYNDCREALAAGWKPTLK